MSEHRISPRERFQQPIERGPTGRGLCRNCHQEVPKGRISWCGKECLEVFNMLTNPGHVRYRVLDRDKGICAMCSRDCAALEMELEQLHSETYGYRRVGEHWRDATAEERVAAQRRYALRIGDLRLEGFNVHDGPWVSTFAVWEADHVVPVSEGGGECGLDGYRTLCTPCHKRVTAELRKRLAKPKPAPRRPDPTLFDNYAEPRFTATMGASP